MSDEERTWAAVDALLEDRLIGTDPVLEGALARTEAAGIPAIAVSAAQGKLLWLLARSVGARRVLEIGTLAGYSSIWLARALPEDGHLDTLELNPRHADVAHENLARAGLADRVEIWIGPAMQSLAVLAARVPRPYDLVFIDADKANSAEYVRWALRLTRPGSLIVVDNVVRGGAVADPDPADESAQGARALLDLLATEPCLASTAIQTVGCKGYDGFSISLVLP